MEKAQAVGALPGVLTAAQKRERPRLADRRPAKVDAIPGPERRRQAMMAAVHPTHALHSLGPFMFCVQCALYSETRVAALASVCPKEASDSGRLRRLLAGLHPRDQTPLGEVRRVAAIRA